MRTSCCFGPYPPTFNQPSLIPLKPPQVSLFKNEGCCWRRKFIVMGVASYCTVIGLEMCLEAIAMPMNEEEASNNSLVLVSGPKWSEKRTCPPWQANSLETIVPENLPRPSARRRYEAVRSTSKAAPPLSVSINTGGSCFSM